MTRRFFCSPLCSVIALIFLAILVVGGLTWVSVVSLRVEESQRRSAIQAHAANQERLALWRLDSHMLSPLGLENNRPYSHYTALHAPSHIVIDETGSPSIDPGRVPSPLLGADLPEWMKLHVQIDANSGWQSPQVISAELAERMRTGPLELSLTNVTPERATHLDGLRAAFSTAAILKRLAEQDRIEPVDEAYIVPVPLADEPSTEKPGPSSDDAVGLMRESGESWLVTEAAVLHSDRFEAKLGGTARRGIYCELPDDSRAKDTLKTAQFKREAEKKVPGLPADQTYPLAQEQLPAPLPIAPRPRELTPAEVDRDAQARKLAVDKTNTTRGGYAIGPGKTQAAPQAPGMKQLNEKEGQAIGPFNNSVQLPDQLTVQWIENMTRSIQNRANDGALKGQTAKADEKKKVEPKPGEGIASIPGGGRSGLGGSSDTRFAESKTRASRGQGFANIDLADAKPGPIVAPVAVHLGPMRARWLADEAGIQHLFLLRSVKLGARVVYQGLAVDWPKLQAALRAELADIFPAAELRPAISDSEPAHERTMTALPVRLDPGNDATPAAEGWSPLRSGLVIAWAAALLAIGAVSFGGRAILATSERRIRFASAVTHELRTPLTAMQLHLDLLNSGLVQDEEKKSEFLATITSEAQRLNQLVENVLAFAKLEKRSAQAQAKWVPVEDVRRIIRQTWTERLATEGFELVINSTASVRSEVHIDPRVLEQVLGNLIDNARKYAKSATDRRIWLWIKPAGGGRLSFEVEDRGPGVPTAEQRSIFQTFRRGSSSTDTGGAGLGLSLAKQWAELFGGSLSYRPADGGTGACFRLELAAK